MLSFFKNLFTSNTKNVYSVGPNTFAELLQQFDQPSKVKTQEEINKDYLIKEAMANLEVEMLRLEPSIFYKGQQIWKNGEKMFYDWVYCSIRPEVLYCSYGKN